jgi:hypothetical protein
VSKGTTIRSVRVPDDLWDAALARSDKEATNVSEVWRELLQAWVDGRIQLH